MNFKSYYSDRLLEAKKYHEDANDLWGPLNLEKAAQEQIRIGNVYRRLDDLDPDSNDKWLKKAIGAYHQAGKMLGCEEYLRILDSDSNDYLVEVKKIEDELLKKSLTKKITHHLANSLSNLAETHIRQYLTDSGKQEGDPNERDIGIACKLLDYASKCYQEAVKKMEEDEEWKIRIKEEERNLSLRDDLAWCITLHGYALIKQKPPEDSNNRCDYYKHTIEILTEAMEYFGEQRDVDQGHLVLNLFALTVPHIELENKQEAQKIFLDACKRLRSLTRQEKKVWYVDYVCDIMDELFDEQRRFQVDSESDKENVERLKAWLKATRVRQGRRALDKIIEGLDKKLKKIEGVDS